MLRKYLWPLTSAAIVVAATPLAVGNVAWAGSPANAFGLFETIPVPKTLSNNTAGGLYSYDISWVDQATHRYYLADRSNNTVDIVDTRSNTLIGQLDVGSFAGVLPPAFSANTGGPNGVATSGHCLFVTDAPSRVAAYDTTPFPPTFVNDVHTDPSDPTRADELAVDPTHSLILAINNVPMPPYGTFIKYNPTTCRLTQPSSPGADRVTFTTATNGAEQPVWDPGTSKFYLSIPQISGVAKNGAVFRIDPLSKMVDSSYPVTYCSPAGLTKGPGNDVLVGCNMVFDTLGNPWNATDPNTAAPIDVILNVKTGDQLRVGGAGAGDEVWFNSEDGNYYATGSTSPLRPLNITPSPPIPPLTAQGAAVLGVIDALHGQLLQLVPTFNVPAVTTGPPTSQHPAGTSHSVAADGEFGLVYVALGANNVYPDCTTGCIAVYARGAPEQPIEVVLPPP